MTPTPAAVDMRHLLLGVPVAICESADEVARHDSRHAVAVWGHHFPVMWLQTVHEAVNKCAA